MKILLQKQIFENERKFYKLQCSQRHKDNTFLEIGFVIILKQTPHKKTFHQTLYTV